MAARMMPPVARCCAHEFRKPRLRRSVEGGGRLVKEPDRAREGDKPGERKAPTLARGEIGRGQVGESTEPEDASASFQTRRVAPR